MSHGGMSNGTIVATPPHSWSSSSQSPHPSIDTSSPISLQIFNLSLFLIFIASVAFLDANELYQKNNSKKRRTTFQKTSRRRIHQLSKTTTTNGYCSIRRVTTTTNVVTSTTNGKGGNGKVLLSGVVNRTIDYNTKRLSKGRTTTNGVVNHRIDEYKTTSNITKEEVVVPNGIHVEQRQPLKTFSKEEILLQSCPDSTLTECSRFLIARDGDVKAAAIKLNSYLEWRKLYRLDDIHLRNPPHLPKNATQDEIDWLRASTLAITATTSPTTPTTTTTTTTLPRIVLMDSQNTPHTTTPILTKHKTRILQVLAARLDPHLATPSTYALAVAFYLTQKFHRTSNEKSTVLIDVRAGRGWANPSPRSVIPFVKLVSRLLANHFPERLERCFVFPIPRAAKVIWNVVKVFLDPETVKKIEVVAGSAGWDDGIAERCALRDWLEGGVVDLLEERRVAMFEM